MAEKGTVVSARDGSGGGHGTSLVGRGGGGAFGASDSEAVVFLDFLERAGDVLAKARMATCGLLRDGATREPRTPASAEDRGRISAVVC